MAEKIFLLVSALVWCVVGAQRTLYASAPEERGAYFVKGRTVYNYGYNTGDGIAKVEARHPDGSVTGSYRYFDPLGNQIVRSYIADKKGFRVLGNALPVAPETPALGVVPEETLFGTAEGTGDPSGSNHHTSSFLLRDNTKPSTNRVIRHNRNAETNNKHDRLIQQQQEIIRKHERELERLKAESNRLYSESNNIHRSYSPTPQHSSTRFAPGGYYSSVDDTNPLRGIYFYHNNKRNYDFPAGFRFADPRAYQRSSQSRDLLQFTDRLY